MKTFEEWYQDHFGDQITPAGTYAYNSTDHFTLYVFDCLMGRCDFDEEDS